MSIVLLFKMVYRSARLKLHTKHFYYIHTIRICIAFERMTVLCFRRAVIVIWFFCMRMSQIDEIHVEYYPNLYNKIPEKEIWKHHKEYRRLVSIEWSVNKNRRRFLCFIFSSSLLRFHFVKFSFLSPSCSMNHFYGFCLSSH